MMENHFLSYPRPFGPHKSQNNCLKSLNFEKNDTFEAKMTYFNKHMYFRRPVGIQLFCGLEDVYNNYVFGEFQKNRWGSGSVA